MQPNFSRRKLPCQESCRTWVERPLLQIGAHP
jgi:hypothetical protein